MDLFSILLILDLQKYVMVSFIQSQASMSQSSVRQTISASIHTHLFLQLLQLRKEAERRQTSKGALDHESSPQATTQQNIELHLRADAFPISNGRDTTPDAWSYSKPDDIEDSQGASPRKHPRGLSMFESELLEERQSSQTEPAPSRPEISIR